MKLVAKVLRIAHRLLLMGEEGELSSWLIFAVLLGAYLGFSLTLISVFGTNVILEYTRYGHDNAAHLYIPRAVVDNGENSKLSNLGVVWLPLYHLTVMFLTPIDLLYTTGLAGAIINAVVTAATASAIYMLIRGKAGILAAAAYGANMYTVVHASSSYMVPIGQFLAVSALYYFSRYCRNSSLKSLTKASALVLLATLARYEAWLVVAALAVAVGVNEVKRRRWWVLAYVAPAYLGILGWLTYNAVIFGNPLEFIVHPSPGAAGYYNLIIERLTNPLSANYLGIGRVAYKLAGPLAVLAPLGIIKYIAESRLRELTFMLTPLAILLAEGEGLLIIDHPLYFYFTLPYLVILGVEGFTWAVKALKSRKVQVLATLMVLFLIAAHNSLTYGVLGNELINATSGYEKDLQLANVVIYAWSVRGGYVLCSSIANSYKISVLSGLSPRYIVDEYDMPNYVNVSKVSWRYNVTVIVMPTYDKYVSEEAFYNSLIRQNYVTLYYSNTTWRSELLDRYEVVGQYAGYYILVIK